MQETKIRIEMKLMKATLTALILMAGVVSSFGINPQYEKFMNLKFRENAANFEAGQFQSIAGKFNGKAIDTLTLFPMDGEEDGDIFYYDKWVLISRNGTVPSKVISSFYPEIVMEGDLDGNGKDEFGVLITGMSSNWCGYHVYTVYNGKVDQMLETGWWLGNEEPLNFIVNAGSRKGEVIVRSYGWDNRNENIQLITKKRRITKYLR